MSLQAALIPVTPFQQNCALIWDEATMQGAVIDPGGDVPRILEAVKSAGVAVTDIFLTHGHLDHAGGASALAQALGVRITGPSREDEFLLDGIAAQARQFGFEADNCKPDAWLAEGDTITIAGADFAVLHCPGHTPGHVVFVNEATKFGIFGDVLFRRSVGRTDFPYGDTATLINGIQTKLMTLPDDFAFICGHGEGSTIGAERQGNPFLK